MKRFIAFALLALLAIPAGAALVTDAAPFLTFGRHHAYLYEDTSAANTQVVLTTTASQWPRFLRVVTVVCSASTTVTATTTVTRAKAVSGTVSVALPSIAITSGTSGAMYLDVLLMPADVAVVTVPQAGSGITCTAQVLEEAR